MLFTFKRDADGRETICLGDTTIALTTPPAGVMADHVREACVMADEAGFWDSDEWTDGDGVATLVPPPGEVTVNVPIPETTSTILSVTREDA